MREIQKLLCLTDWNECFSRQWLMINFKIGCSGYHYPGWENIFYPHDIPKVKWFDFYCEHFNTIELNVTFYKFPRVEAMRRWYDRAPDDFTFSVKAPRVITHFKKLKDSAKYLHDFYSAVQAGLREKTGCVLFQFPAPFEFDDDRLERIAELLNPDFKNVVEFRHSSWWSDRVFQTLRKKKIIFSGMSHPTLPDSVISTSPTLYYRFHGVPHLYLSEYPIADLEGVADSVIGNTEIREAYLIFNNTTEGAALRNAKGLKEIVELVH
jgi:uncharacterized protein YecE (DUF72 family)